MAKLRKKLVKNNGFWKINAIRPEIKARRGRMRKFNFGQKANWGGLVKELGCQIGAKRRTFHRLFTTRFLFRKLQHFA